jgi:hypothetical protein
VAGAVIRLRRTAAEETPRRDLKGCLQLKFTIGLTITFRVNAICAVLNCLAITGGGGQVSGTMLGNCANFSSAMGSSRARR